MNEKKCGYRMNEKINFACENILYEGDRVLFTPLDRNMILSLDLASDTVEILGKIPEGGLNKKRLSSSILKCDDYYLFVPFLAERIWISDSSFCRWDAIDLPHKIQANKFYRGFIYNGKVFMIPTHYPYIVQIDVCKKEVRELDIPVKPQEELDSKYGYFFSNFVKEGNFLYLASCCSNAVLILNLDTLEYEWKTVGSKENKYVAIAKKDNFFWLAPRRNTRIVRWNGNDVYEEYELIQNYDDKYIYLGVVDNGNIFLPSIIENESVYMDQAGVHKNSCDNGYIFAENVENGTLLLADYHGNLWIQSSQQKIERHLSITQEQLDEYIERNIKNIRDYTSEDVVNEDEVINLRNFIKFI